ncbi:MAG: hypothetical protein HUU41_07955 [Bryobacteraceae bacterium]|nr:hypothetical protein [Bryobacterales bacterium]MEB2361621.1 hypothetical protein [Bryobacterales bacterium]NUN01032.1 hypothetical protein [Bryobacteraceae bacterium]
MENEHQLLAPSERIAPAAPRPSSFRLLNERRTCVRYPITLDLRYRASTPKAADLGHQSTTVEISSQAISFSTPEPLPAGAQVETSIRWPFLLDNRTPLQLVADGKVVRSTEGKTVIRIHKYEFRTCRKQAFDAISGLT